MPTATIDGQSGEFADGQTIIQAAEQLGIEIPHYCWHPGLPVAGNCRMCLVEIEKVPKLQIACNTRVTEGMVVSTGNPRVKKAQESVLEFLLVNHPIDCPICDQAGECKLQDYYMDYDQRPSRFAVEEKNRKRKVVELGPRVVLDQERCILCLRCTRFLDEVTETSELGVYARGDRAHIDLAPGKTLDNEYSENVVDICPVGALTSRDFRFQARVWYLDSAPSVCTGCARGCNVDVYHRKGEIFRLRPRFNEHVNQYWMCDRGRRTFQEWQGDDRLLAPQLRDGEAMAEAEWGEVSGRIAAALKGVDGAVAAIVSGRTTNEEAFLVQELVAQLGGGPVVGYAPIPAGAADDDLLLRADPAPNRKGLEALGIDCGPAAASDLLGKVSDSGLRALIVHEADLVGGLGLEQTESALEGLDFLVVLSARNNETALYADATLPIASLFETGGTVTNFEGRIQALEAAHPPPGRAREGWRALQMLLEAVAPEAAAWDGPGAVLDAAAQKHSTIDLAPLATSDAPSPTP